MWVERAIESLTKAISNFGEKGVSNRSIQATAVYFSPDRCPHNIYFPALSDRAISTDDNHRDVSVWCDCIYDTAFVWLRQQRYRCCYECFVLHIPRLKHLFRSYKLACDVLEELDRVSTHCQVSTVG